jgi:hypothetical protein
MSAARKDTMVERRDVEFEVEAGDRLRGWKPWRRRSRQ